MANQRGQRPIALSSLSLLDEYTVKLGDVPLREKPPGSISPLELAQKTGHGERVCRRKLYDDYVAGKLDRSAVMIGRSVTYYYFKKPCSSQS